jgi:hypothetical protein
LIAVTVDSTSPPRWLAELRVLMEDPRLVVNGHLLFSTSGQRPA